MKTSFIIAGILALVVIGWAAFIFIWEEDAQTINNFAECADLGFPVTESYPRQCRANGQVFTEEITATEKDDLIRVSAPQPNEEIVSPLTVRGEARGNWYFEASFPAEIIDGNGKQLGIIPIQAQGEWMTTDYVPFETSFSFATATTPTGTLILHKDNPSGLPENDNQLRLPIRFKNVAAGPERTIKLYYYNALKDKDAQGNIQCSSKGLVPVERKIPVTLSPIQDAVKLLLKGELTAAERAQGITTEYPLPGVELKSASLNQGALALAFSDPQNKTGGGSCRVAILWAQIEATAKQFSNVQTVSFTPEELFQP